MTSLTVGCPAFNEEAAVERVVAECLERIPRIADDFELLLVDDGSTDRTGAILDELARKDAHVRVIHHPYNLGFRGIAQTLPLNADKELFIGISADGEIRIDDIGRMVEMLERDALDVVIGVRSAKPNYNAYRRLVSGTYNALVAWTFGTDFRDIGSMKLYRTRILREIPVISRSAFMNAERLVKAKRLGYRVGFCPVEQRPRLGGEAKGARTSWVVGSTVDLVRVAAEIYLGRWRPGSDDHAERR